MPVKYKFSLRKRSIQAVKLSLSALFIFACYLGVMQLTGNFHTVIDGELYRSAQLDAGQIESYHEKYKFKTIINLRGENEGKLWYDEEVAASKKLGIEHINFRMSMKRPFTEKQFNDLLAIYKDAQKPILIHCRAGSDRTGLAVAVYTTAIANRSEEFAEWHLSPYYGHIPYAKAHYMDSSWEVLEPLLGFTDS